MHTYRIADLFVNMDPFGRTLAQSAPYETAFSSHPDIEIRVDHTILMRKWPEMSEDDCAYVATSAGFYRRLVDFGGMMLHASCVVVDKKAYLFSAPSGTGKSTHTGLWLRRFGDRAYILNDDKPAIRSIDGGLFVYGTPWSGKTDLSRNARVPLGGIGILSRGEENRVRRIGGAEAVYGLLDQTVRPTDPRQIRVLMGIIDQIVGTKKVFHVEVNMEAEAAQIVYDAMNGESE